MSLLRKKHLTTQVGTLTIAVKIPRYVLIPGDNIQVELTVTAGDQPERLTELYMALCCSYQHQDPVQHISSSLTTPLIDWVLTEPIHLAANQSHHLSIPLQLPLNTPITIGESQVWLQTQASTAEDSGVIQHQQITIRPDPLMDGIFTALEFAGLRVRLVECEEIDGFALPFLQAFELIPVSGRFHGLWRELSLGAYYDSDGVHLWVEIERLHQKDAPALETLLETEDLKHHFLVSSALHPQQAGEHVLAYLDSIVEDYTEA